MRTTCWRPTTRTQRRTGPATSRRRRTEIAQSKYDTNQDGVCDAPVCKDVLTISDRSDPYPKQLALLRQVLEPLGITLSAKPLERSTMYARCEDPNSDWALCTGTGWGKDYPDGFTFASPLLSANVTNYSFDQFAGLPALDRVAIESGSA